MRSKVTRDGTGFEEGVPSPVQTHFEMRAVAATQTFLRASQRLEL